MRLEPRQSRKCDESSSVFKRLTLKLPSKISSLFSRPTLWRNGFKKSELKDFSDIHGCL